MKGMQKRNYIQYLVGGTALAGLIALLILPRLSDPYKAQRKAWAAAGVGCLPNGHTNISQHIHPTLRIAADGVDEQLPGEIGSVRTCMAEIHTHEAGGVIHVETVDAFKKMTLGQFFVVWDKELARPGYKLKATAGGREVADPAALTLEDKQTIVLEYTGKKN